MTKESERDFKNEEVMKGSYVEMLNSPSNQRNQIKTLAEKDPADSIVEFYNHISNETVNVNLPNKKSM